MVEKTVIKLVIPEEENEEKTFKLVIPNIDNGGRLPRKFTGEGKGRRRSYLHWWDGMGCLDGTKSMALLVQDMDALDPSSPIRPWTYWVVVNIPPTLKGLPEGISHKEEEMGGDYAHIREGINDWKIHGWRGPYPHTARHRYLFKLFALTDDHLISTLMCEILGS